MDIIVINEHERKIYSSTDSFSKINAILESYRKEGWIFDDFKIVTYEPGNPVRAFMIHTSTSITESTFES